MNLFSHKTRTIIPIFCVLALASCKSDDTPEENQEEDPLAVLEAAREETTQQLSGGDEKVWKIASASLTNESGTFDISNNFNVVDDEFIFSSMGILEWRQGNDINIDATTQQETLLDYYRSPISTSFEYKEESSTEFTAVDGRITLTVNGDNAMSGVIAYPGRIAGGEITVTLNEKGPEDYPDIPENGLTFSELVTFEDQDIWGQANVGMTGSYADNSLYIANRTAYNPSVHQTRKLDIDTGNFTLNTFEYTDFYTKRTFVINNELIIFGGSYIYTYDLDISTEPTLIDHGLGGIGISRFGASSYDDEIYIVGGDLDEIESDLIRKFNPATGEISLVGSLPGPKTHAGAEIVNNVLYVFSGREQFVEDATVSTTSYSYNLLTGETTTFDTTYPMMNTYASRFQNLIYVCGDIQEDFDGDGIIDNIDISLGVYNTETDIYTELDHDLDDTIDYFTVAGMTVFNGKMYVIYGDAANGAGTWSIMVADVQ